MLSQFNLIPGGALPPNLQEQLQEDKAERCALTALKTHAVISVFDLFLPPLALVQPMELRLVMLCVTNMMYQTWFPLMVIWLNFGTLREAAARLWETLTGVVMKFLCCQDQIPLFDVQQ